MVKTQGLITVYPKCDCSLIRMMNQNMPCTFYSKVMRFISCARLDAMEVLNNGTIFTVEKHVEDRLELRPKCHCNKDGAVTFIHKDM